MGDPLAAATDRVVDAALAEDLGEAGDVTSRATVPAGATGTAAIVARRGGVVAGLPAVRAVFARVDEDVRLGPRCQDGDPVAGGTVLAEVSGPLAALLAAERTALNLLGHLSGVATRTRAFVEAVAGTGCRIRDTRKTTPGLRLLDKAAVAAGGGDNHRLGLSDALLVKDNHIAAAGGAGEAARRAVAGAGGRPVEVEIDDLEQLEPVLEAGVTEVLLDNLAPPQLAEAVARTAGRARLEASGSVTLETVRTVAETGVDCIAVGALTHSAPWLDVALEVAPGDRAGAGPGGR